VADAIIEQYGTFYPELEKHGQAIRDSLTREEIRFSRTVESGTAYLQGMLDDLRRDDKTVLEGNKAFDLYATYGLPLEISRDIAREQGLDVDESGFRAAMDEHRIASGAGKAMGALGGEDAEFFARIAKDLQARGKLPSEGVLYDPYNDLEVSGELLALIVDGQSVNEAQFGDSVEVIIPRTGFYLESGGQVSDSGYIKGLGWEIEISDVRRPAPGLIVHMGEVISGKPKVGEPAVAEVNKSRRHDIMRNHTATHLMHAALHQVLGEHARQAGSLVAPDHLRFDFNHPEAMTADQIEQVERLVNEAVAADFVVQPKLKPREEAIAEGAMALFGEKYGETVRTITIKDGDTEGEKSHSYELCGGTHLERTSDVGAFIITSEGSTAAGIRRIEAVTGRGAYNLNARRARVLKRTAGILKSSIDEIPHKVEILQDELAGAKKQVAALRAEFAKSAFETQLQAVEVVKGIAILAMEIPNVDVEILRSSTDVFRERYPSNSVCVLGTIVDEKPAVIAAITDDLVKRGLKAGDLVKFVAEPMGGSGGGKPTLAQAGGKDASKLPEALRSVKGWVESKVG
jgi:alanyl-tRNA synthetase